MGLGDDFNEDLLIEIANAICGAFFFIESPDVAPSIFQEELRGLLSVVGQNLSISLEPTEHVTGVTQLNAYPEERDGKRVTYNLGDVFGEEIKTLALEMALPGIDQLGEQQIATLRFEYDELSTSGVEHRVMDMPVIINIAEQDAQPALPNSEVSRSVLLLKSAQARQEAVEKADGGHYSAASEVLRSAAAAIEESGIHHEALVEEKDALLKQAESLEQGAAEFKARRRKMMSTEAIYTMTDRHMATQAMRIREFERVNKGEVPNTQRIDGKVPTLITWGDKQFELDGDLIRIGRAPQNEILIDVNGVSRFHCQIRREDDQLVLEDLNSTNGTYVGGEAIKQPHILNSGDEVFVCNEKLVFSGN
jgi:hypothetical protein